MPLNEKVRAQVAKKLEEYEGRVRHFYLDSLGKVTVGVGHLVVNKDAAPSLVMYEARQGAPRVRASPEAIRKEYDNVARQARGYRASYYKQFSTLVMLDGDIDALRDKHIDGFYRELAAIYKKTNGSAMDIDQMPEKVQLALFDMIFNLGATKLQAVFKKFDASIKAGKWREAAMHSNRPQVSSARNLYVKTLLETAANGN